MVLSKDYIKKIVTDYFKDKPVNKVWLFGSYARGDADDKSDIDVLVDINNNIGLHYLLWHEELEEIIQRKVDVVSNKGVSRFIKPFIDADKELVYEK